MGLCNLSYGSLKRGKYNPSFMGLSTLSNASSRKAKMSISSVQRSLPSYVFAVVLWAALMTSVGCGKEIGDGCTTANDCAQDGTRACDPDSNSPGGYCTVIGCEFGSCPGEAVCIRFFPGASTNLPCNPELEDTGEEDRCLPDEVCTLGGVCVPRTAESRFCMRRCNGGGDCRGGYECRDEELMVSHGGEPVSNPDGEEDATETLQGFCAPSPS